MSGLVFLQVLCLLVLAVRCEENPREVNVENLQRFASLTPNQLQRTLHYLENPYIAASLVEGGKNTPRGGRGRIPPVFDEPPLNADLQNYLLGRTLQQKGDDNSKSSTLPAYFDVVASEKSNEDRNYEAPTDTKTHYPQHQNTAEERSLMFSL